jgi:hypothetical protein
VFERTTIPNPEPCDILDLFSLVLHEAKHGVLRMKRGNFNGHTPTLFPNVHPPEKSGYLVAEKDIWNGVIPRWFSPIQKKEARFLATEIIHAFHQLGNLMITNEVKDRILTVVGARSPTITDGAVDINAEPIFE